MLVDDNEIDNLINEKMIEASNFAEQVTCFSGGVSALDFLKNIDRVKGLSEELIPEILFLDLNMPLLDGFQFLDEFDKLSDKIKSACHVLVLTSSLSEEDMARAKENALVEDFVNKPLSEEILEGISV